MRVLLDSFSVGLDDLPRKHHSDLSEILRILHKHGRFSVFEATISRAMGAAMTRIMREGFVEDLGGDFPWKNVKLTQKGLDALDGRMMHGPADNPLRDFVRVGNQYFHKSIALTVATPTKKARAR